MELARVCTYQVCLLVGSPCFIVDAGSPTCVVSNFIYFRHCWTSQQTYHHQQQHNTHFLWLINQQFFKKRWMLEWCIYIEREESRVCFRLSNCMHDMREYYENFYKYGRKYIYLTCDEWWCVSTFKVWDHIYMDLLGRLKFNLF